MLKSFIQRFFVIAILASLLSTHSFAAVDYRIEDQQHVIEKVIQFEQRGILKQKENGYLYVEVSGDFIAEVLPLIDTHDIIVAPKSYTSKKGIGAHISVMYETELEQHEIWDIKELGQEFTFTVLDVRTVKVRMDNKVKKLWLLAVDAPGLEVLRESYGLCSKLKGHDFHITIGTQALEMTRDVEDFKQAA